MSMTPETPLPPKGRLELRPIPMLIFGSRWLQLPLYVGLIVAQGIYVVLFLKELWHLIAHSFDFSEQQIMLVVLGLIDVVMISNLLIMVIVGGYETFVSRLELESHPYQPEWLSHVNASVLKITSPPGASSEARSEMSFIGSGTCSKTSNAVSRSNFPSASRKKSSAI